MEYFNQLAQNPAWLALILCGIAALLIALLILGIRSRSSLSRGQMDAIEQAVQRVTRAEAMYSAENRRAEQEMLTREMRDMGDSLTQYLAELGRGQQQQLDSFHAQLRMIHQANEERMERMRQQIEAQLMTYDRQMTNISQTLDAKLNTNERRIAEMRQTLDAGMTRLQGENEKKLEQIRVTVDEKLNTTLDKRLGDSFRTVSERLEQVYRGLGEMQTLAVGVGDLKKVLTGVKTRGIWGEVQLGVLLEQALTPEQYETNVAVKKGSTERVEFAVRLPGKDSGHVYLPIDAKFPAEDYQKLLDATEAGDKPGIEAAGRALENTIRTEARRIRTKYIDPPNTTDFAIMFLPVEGLFAEVLRRPGIVEALQNEHRVVVTGPTTLLALLNSLQMGFRTIAIEQRSSEVWELLGAVKTEFSRFADLLAKTQQRLKQASDSIDIAARKTRTIERKLKNVQMLSGPSQEDWATQLRIEEEEEPDDL